MKMKFTNINLLLSASATTVIITAPLISAQVSCLSDSICFVALFVNSISFSYMCHLTTTSLLAPSLFFAINFYLV